LGNKLIVQQKWCATAIYFYKVTVRMLRPSTHIALKASVKAFANDAPLERGV